jgi:hypothetical protein
MNDNITFGKAAMSIFTFILIISGNYIGNLLPCRVQSLFTNNMFVKHFLGYFTMLFFVSLALDNSVNLFKLSYSSLLFYLYFIILRNTHAYVWVSTFVTLSIIYLIQLRKKDIINKNKDADTKYYTMVQKYMAYVSMLITTIGFFIYMGEKKIEYAGTFSYIQFLFGAVSCANSTPHIPILTALKHVFD